MAKSRRIRNRWITWGEMGRKKDQIVKNIPYKAHLRGLRAAKKVKKKQLVAGLLSACFSLFMVILGIIFGDYWIYVAIIFVVVGLLVAIAAFYE